MLHWASAFWACMIRPGYESLVKVSSGCIYVDSTVSDEAQDETDDVDGM